MPRLTPYAAQEIAMVSSTPAGSGFPIGLIPGALPSDQASRQTLKTTAVRLPLGHTQFTGLVMRCRAPQFFLGTSYQLAAGGQRHIIAPRNLCGLPCAFTHAVPTLPPPYPPPHAGGGREGAQSRVRPARQVTGCGRRLCPPYGFMIGTH